MALQDVAEKYRAKPIKFAHVVVEAETIRLFITYADKTEVSLKLKTREGAEQLKELLFVKPAPCKLCGYEPKILDGMVSCLHCSIHTTSTKKWDTIMREPPNVRQMVADLTEPLRVCRWVITEGSNEPLVGHMAINALTKIGKLDLSEFYERADDARAAEKSLLQNT